MRLARRQTFMAAAAWLMGSSTRIEARQPGKKIAVIGAGMAGLAAARTLADAGADVEVFEARQRIGGRVWTSRLWPDLPVDMGASWIHGAKGNPLSSLADQAGARRVVTDYDSALAFEPGGTEVTPPDPWESVAEAQAHALDHGHDLSLMAAVMALPLWSAMTSAEQADLRQAIYRAVEHEYAADWGQLSARHFDSADSFGGPDMLFPNGMDALCHWAARGLAIRLGRVLRRISLAPQGVTLHFEDGTVESAERVIVTVPLGVLRAGKIDFQPGLSDERMGAIGRLGMGQMMKCWLRFDARLPWPDVDWLEYIRPAEAAVPAWAEWVNGRPALGADVMLGFCASTSAAEMARVSAAAAAASALEALKDMAGGRALPALRAAQVSDWGNDPFSLGAYSYYPTGATPQDRAALAGTDWDDHLIFAGEATSVDHPATAHGAWLSGLAAARHILVRR